MMAVLPLLALVADPDDPVPFNRGLCGLVLVICGVVCLLPTRQRRLESRQPRRLALISVIFLVIGVLMMVSAYRYYTN